MVILRLVIIVFVYVELSEDTYRRWKEASGNNALAVHLLFCLSQLLSTVSPLDQGEGTFESGIAFSMDMPSVLEYAIFVLLKMLLHNGIIIIKVP